MWIDALVMSNPTSQYQDAETKQPLFLSLSLSLHLCSVFSVGDAAMVATYSDVVDVLFAVVQRIEEDSNKRE